MVRPDDEELQAIAFGHDLLEDCDISVQELREYTLNDRIVAGIVALTKKDDMTYEQYLSQVSENQDAILVKLADLKDNMDPRRIKAGISDEKEAERMKKYTKAYQYLLTYSTIFNKE